MSSLVEIQIGQAGRVALGPFLQPDGQTPATVLPEAPEITILGTTVAGVPTRRQAGTDRAPEAVAGQPGFFWVDLLPSDTEGLKGIATLGAADSGPAAILWLKRAPEAAQAL